MLVEFNPNNMDVVAANGTTETTSTQAATTEVVSEEKKAIEEAKTDENAAVAFEPDEGQATGNVQTGVEINGVMVYAAPANPYYNEEHGRSFSEYSEAEVAEMRKDFANAHAMWLHAAMNGLGTDSSGVFDALAGGQAGSVPPVGEEVGPRELYDIKVAYNELFGESLENAIKSDFSFDTEDALLLILSKADPDAEYATNDTLFVDCFVQGGGNWALYEAFKEATYGRIGTDEIVVNEIFSSSESILKLLHSGAMTEEDVREWIKNDFSGEQEQNLLNKLDNAIAGN